WGARGPAGFVFPPGGAPPPPGPQTPRRRWGGGGGGAALGARPTAVTAPKWQLRTENYR
ncbi:hypothetical protein ABIE24_003462, partial [Mycetocola sp. 2940]